MPTPKIIKQNIFLIHWLYPFLLMIFTMSMVFTLFKWYAYIFDYKPWINEAWSNLYPIRIIFSFYVNFLVIFGLPIIVYMTLMKYLIYKQKINIWIKWGITLLIPIVLLIYPGFGIELWIDDIGEYVNREYFIAFEVMAIVYFLYSLKKIKPLNEWAF